MRKLITTLGALWLCMIPVQLQAFDMSAGQYAILLQSLDGTEVEVGNITLSQSGDQLTYDISWDDAKFSDQFLSMRPFKCLDGAKKQWCRVPYPYENKRSLSGDDLTDLEYDLLFIWKKNGDYGIDMWNGVYYDLEASDQGLEGQMHEMDLDILSAPPEDGNLRPVGEYDIELADPDSHWLPTILIRQK